MSSAKNGVLAVSLIIFVAAGCSFPLVVSWSQQRDLSKPLSGQAAIRGAYTNVGSKDIGKDPDYKPRARVLAPARHGTHAPFTCAPHCKAARRWQPLTCNAKPDTKEVGAQHVAEAAMAGLMTLAAMLGPCLPASAVLNSPNAGIPRTVDAALRRSIPATNQDVRQVQRSLEDISFKLRIPQRKPWQQMTDDIVKATSIVNNESKVMYGVPTGQEEQAKQLVEEIRARIVKVNAAIDAKDADKVSSRTASTLQSVAALELIQAPGLSFSIPAQYESFPRLTGRAKVQLTIERKGEEGAFVDNGGGGGKAQAQVVLELDGFSAPITAGNFAANVLAGAYDGSALTVGGETVSVSGGKLQGKVLPMEMLPLGEFEPVYRSALDVQNGELPVLPLSIFGAVAMAHPSGDAGEGYAAANEFFLYKFDKSSSGLAGLSFEEGTFPVFGFVVKGMEIVPQLQTGDVITEAKLLSGSDRLILPEGSLPASMTE